MRRTTACVVAVAGVLAGCSDGGDAATDPPAAVPTIEAGTLTACVAPGPQLAEETATGLEGYDVAVLEAVAEELGIELAVVPTPFDDVVAGVALNGGDCDVAAAGVVDRPELAEVATATSPYRTVHLLVVATTGGPTVAPGELAGRVGVEAGGPAAGAAASLSAAEVVEYPSRADLGRALAQDLVDGALVTVVDRAALEEQLGEPVDVRATVPTDDRTVLLLPLEAPDELLTAIDDALVALDGSGRLTALQDAWLLR